MKQVKKTLYWVALFAIAMGYLESSVVIYLRELYYPEGFRFPLREIPVFVARVEFFREMATIVMLIGCGYLAGKTALQRFAYFVLAFSVWDIFYYVFLYVCLGWPMSLATWDILFLIPVPWVGPVWAPCLLALLMLAGSVYILLKTEKTPTFHISRLQWLIMLGGVFACILSFMLDYLSCTWQNHTWSVFSSDALFADLRNYVPVQFNEALFLGGFGFMCASIISTILKNTTNENQ